MKKTPTGKTKAPAAKGKSAAEPTRLQKAVTQAEAKERITSAKVAKSGLTSRIRGHVSAAGKRRQGKRDSR